jgi:hypothetical protein
MGDGREDFQQPGEWVIIVAFRKHDHLIDHCEQVIKVGIVRRHEDGGGDVAPRTGGVLHDGLSIKLCLSHGDTSLLPFVFVILGVGQDCKDIHRITGEFHDSNQACCIATNVEDEQILLDEIHLSQMSLLSVAEQKTAPTGNSTSSGKYTARRIKARFYLL